MVRREKAEAERRLPVRDADDVTLTYERAASDIDEFTDGELITRLGWRCREPSESSEPFIGHQRNRREPSRSESIEEIPTEIEEHLGVVSVELGDDGLTRDTVEQRHL